ncbi:MAG TPA: HPr family phosphocarrier protein [bacterium]|nr:HPr family phosphocarrier protein [bacterium]
MMTKKGPGSLVKIMDEEEIKRDFVPRLNIITKPLFIIFEELIQKEDFPDRELIFSIMREVDEIETFLDDYGASHNKKFFYFRELIGSIRWINIFIFQGLHILARVKSYNLDVSEREKAIFIKELKKTITLYLTTLKNLGATLQEEALKIGIKKPREKYSKKKMLIEIQKKILPPDIEEDVVKEKEERTISILVKFLENAEMFNTFVCGIKSDEEITEEIMEKYRSIFNQIESLYDTFLKNTEIENKYPDLKKIRSYVALSMHLLEMGKALTHFYERHSDKVRKYSSSSQLSRLVPDVTIKETLKEFILNYSIYFLLTGKSTSIKIFKKMGMDADEFIYSTRKLILYSYRIEDFHIRPVMPVTQIAGKYKLDTSLYYNRNKYNLKSPVEMAIAIPDIREGLSKENVEIMIQGPRKSVNEICEFLKEKCGASEKEIVCSLITSSRF